MPDVLRVHPCGGRCQNFLHEAECCIAYPSPTSCVICASVDGHLDSFHPLAAVNNAAVNVAAQIPVQLSAFILGTSTAVGLLGHMVALFLIFCRLTIELSPATAPFYTPRSGAQALQLLCVLSSACFLFLQ